MSKKRSRRRVKVESPPPAWTPFESASPGHSGDVQEDRRFVGTFVNSRYQVSISAVPSAFGEMLWLAIINRDRSCRRDWRDFQRIKNELVGPEREAIELYPAESRLVDTNNQFHLFVFPEGAMIPLGYAARDVADEVEGVHKQRPFEEPPEGLNERVRAGERVLPIFGPPDWPEAKESDDA